LVGEGFLVLGGVVIGLVGGLYNLVRESLEASREAKADDQLASGEVGKVGVAIDSLADMLRLFDGNFPLGEYLIAVAEKVT